MLVNEHLSQPVQKCKKKTLASGVLVVSRAYHLYYFLNA